MVKHARISALAVLAAAGLLGCLAASDRLLVACAHAEQPAQTPHKKPERQALCGDMHIHTSWSIDAYVFGTRAAGPYEAIMFAQGEPVRHPGGFIVQLKRPLDFMLLMDHSEYTGALRLANDPDSAFSKTPLGKHLKAGADADAMGLYRELSAGLVKGEGNKVLQGPDVAGYSWNQICKLAETASRPGKFTVFPGWEWTATPNNRNLHRVVLFKGYANYELD